MLAILIYITDMVRRALRKIVRAAVILGDSYREAQAIRRSLPRIYTED